LTNESLSLNSQPGSLSYQYDAVGRSSPEINLLFFLTCVLSSPLPSAEQGERSEPA
jgi:hypothetical protein